MKFFVDGRLDIRPLAQQDKAHMPVPYDTVVYNGDVTEMGVPENPLANGQNTPVVFTVLDWGAGLNWITLGFNIYLWNATADFLTEDSSGIRVVLANDTDDIGWDETWEGEFNRTMLTDAGLYSFSRSITIPNGFFTAAAQGLSITVYNESGQALHGIVRIMGVAV
ncbi:MAG: hypothetical protein ACXADY_20765 [Candidatus Hodarchaeales archaeon]|jgi:hypothetical protein